MPKKFKNNKPIYTGDFEEVTQQINYWTQKEKNSSKKENTFQTNFEKLESEFPDIDQEIIESIYQENNRSFLLTKKKLEEIFKKNEPEPPKEINKIPQNFDLDLKREISTNSSSSNQIENSFNLIDINSEQQSYEEFNLTAKVNKKKNKKVVDISNIITNNNFSSKENSNNFDEKNPSIILGFKTHEDKKSKKNKAKNKDSIKNENIVNYIKPEEKNKSIKEYVSIFDENLLYQKANENHTPNPDCKDDDIYYFEEMLWDYYMQIIKELFPKLSTEEIMEKLCECNLDIDELILNLLDTENETSSKEIKNLANGNLSNELNSEIFDNFFFEENVNKDALLQNNVQLEIEKQIKKTVNKNNYINNLPDLIDSEENFSYQKEESNEEWFLNKPIEEIETKSFREDLLKLKYNLPFIDEVELKWVYYQYLDYQMTFSHFCKISISNKNKLSKIIENSSNPLKKNHDKIKNNKEKISQGNFININNDIKPKKQKSEIFPPEENTNFTNSLYKIMNDKPENWNMDSSGKINLNEYQNIRRKLMTQAQLSWRSGRHQDAKVIMAKARRYKEEINFLLKNKKVEVFMKNNENNSLMNMISKKENFIDLHGLNYAEAEIITKKKLKDIIERKNSGRLDEDRTFTLTIVTGKGNHSQGGKAVLLPKLADFFSKSSFDHKVEWQNGIIRIFV